MSRKLRLEFPGATYHVINRGNYRQNVFEAKGAAEAFERTLGETCERFGWVIHAYVIMRNHFHLAVETPQPNLSEGVGEVAGRFVGAQNRVKLHLQRETDCQRGVCTFLSQLNEKAGCDRVFHDSRLHGVGRGRFQGVRR